MMYLDRHVDQNESVNYGSNETHLAVYNRVYSYLLKYEAQVKAIMGDDTREEDIDAVMNTFLNLVTPETREYRDDEIAQGINRLIREKMQSAAESRLLSQRNTLLNNNAFQRFNNNQELEWHNFHSGEKPSQEHIQAITAVNSEYVTDIDWVDEFEYCGMSLDKYAESKIIRRVDNLISFMESKTPWNCDVYSRNFDLDKERKHFIETLDKLVEICNELNSDLPGALVKVLFEEGKFVDALKKATINRVDEQLAYINEAFIPPKLSKKDKKAKKLAKYLSSKEVEVEEEVMPIITKTTSPTLDIKETISQDVELKFNYLGEFEFDFNWFKNPKYLQVTRVSGGLQDVVLIHALTPKLEKISKVAHYGLRKKSSGEDKIDQTIKQIVKRIAGGIMPYEDTNSIKRLSTDRKELHVDYQDETIWYSFDISPNAPRVYFTLKDVPTMLLGDDNKPSVMVVVLAEADKARQIETLSRLTTIDIAGLRARGAGSV